MKEDAVLFSGSSFCSACATETAAVSSTETADADVKAATAVSGSSYYCSAAADAAATDSAKNL